MEIGAGLSQGDNSISAAQEAVGQAKANLKEKAELALVFGTPSLSSSSLLKAASEALPGVPIIGSSGKAVICSEGIFKHGVAVMLLNFSGKAHFHAASVINVARRSQLAGEEMGEKLSSGLKDYTRALSLIFCDQLIQSSTHFISGLQSRIGKGLPLAGACPSGDSFFENHLYFNQYITSDACVGITLDSGLSFGIGAGGGWKPLGKSNTVTKAEGNVVESIGGSPASKLYQDYLGYDWPKLKTNLKLAASLYPLGIYLPQEKEYLLRNPISLGASGSVSFSGEVPQNSTVRLMLGTKNTCLAAARQAAAEANANFAACPAARSGYTKRMALVFSSFSRYTLLGQDAKKELEAIQETLGQDTPVIGIYTQAEVTPLSSERYRGQAQLQNQTITIVILGS